MQSIDREHATSLFAQAIAHSILEKSVRAILSHLEQPSEAEGSQASPISQQAHRWFSNLPDSEKPLVRSAILETAWIAFHALCYWLDTGAKAVSESNGRLHFVFLLEAYVSEQAWIEDRSPDWTLQVAPADAGLMFQDLEWSLVIETVRKNQWESLLYAESPTGNAATIPNLAENSAHAFAVGEYYQLRKATAQSDLEVHLVPEPYAARQFLPNYHYKTAPAILLPVGVHYLVHKQSHRDWELSDEPQAFDREDAAELLWYTLFEKVVVNSAIEVHRVLSRSSDWQPSSDSADPIERRTYALQQWYANLDEESRRQLFVIVNNALEIAFHSICYLLDGGVHIQDARFQKVIFACYLEIPNQRGVAEPLMRVAPIWGEGHDLHELTGILPPPSNSAIL